MQHDAIRGYAIAILASADMLSLPPKRTKLQAGRKRALTSDKLDTERKEVREDLVSKLKTVGAAIEALQILLATENEDAAARDENFKRKIEKLQELLRDSEEVVVVKEKEKERARLKEETVSRGYEIAAMQEAVSKLKKEK